MTFDREEYTDLIAEKAKDPVNGQRTNLEIMQQAAVKASHLTGDAHWDTFLSYIEAARTALERDRDNAVNLLKAPNMVDANEIMVLKLSIARLEFGIGLLGGIVSLPKDIQEQGTKAAEILARLDG